MMKQPQNTTLRYIAKAMVDLDAKKNEVVKVVDDKARLVDQKIKEIDDKFSHIKGVAKGDPGRDANDKQIFDTLWERFQSQKYSDEELLVSRVLAKIPKFDEQKFAKKVIGYIGKPKSELKVLRQEVETDPMAILEKILALPKEKFQLKTDNISGLSQTIRAIQNQLGRGYLHGGGISDITGLIQAGTNITLSGNGTKASPYVINASGGGGGSPGGSNQQLQFNDNGSFGGIVGTTWDKDNHFLSLAGGMLNFDIEGAGISFTNAQNFSIGVFGVNAFLIVSDLNTDQSYRFPDQSGTFALTSDIVTGGGVFRAYKESNQSIPSGSIEVVDFSAIVFDTKGEYSNPTYTASVDGYYLVTSCIEFASMNDGDDVEMYIYMNGSQVGKASQLLGNSGDVTLSVSTILSLTSGDTIEIRVYHNHGTDRDIESDQQNTNFCVYKLL